MKTDIAFIGAGPGGSASDRGHPVKWGVSVYGAQGNNPFGVPVMGRDPESGLFHAFTTMRPTAADGELLRSTAHGRWT